MRYIATHENGPFECSILDLETHKICPFGSLYPEVVEIAEKWNEQGAPNGYEWIEIEEYLSMRAAP